MELGFGYQPKAVIIYGKNERGFMADMTPKDVLVRMRLLQTSLKHTTDGIHAELTFYTEALQSWDQQKYQKMDDIQKGEFGWEPLDGDTPGILRMMKQIESSFPSRRLS